MSTDFKDGDFVVVRDWPSTYGRVFRVTSVEEQRSGLTVFALDENRQFRAFPIANVEAAPKRKRRRAELKFASSRERR